VADGNGIVTVVVGGEVGIEPPVAELLPEQELHAAIPNKAKQAAEINFIIFTTLIN